ncbi:MAG TPA: helix-turn-helix transcriptional regulator [Candidatus Limnocylindrales bacterium]|jgi:ribosome-binding protein aMBF1 (putative translation factor)
MKSLDEFRRKTESKARAKGRPAEIELELYRELTRISQDLARARLHLDWTQEKLSSETGIAQSEISKIEQGQGNPTLLTIARLTTALGAHMCIQEKCVAHQTRDQEQPSERMRTCV